MYYIIYDGFFLVLHAQINNYNMLHLFGDDITVTHLCIYLLFIFYFFLVWSSTIYATLLYKPENSISIWLIFHKKESSPSYKR